MTSHTDARASADLPLPCCAFVPPYLLRRLADDTHTLLSADLGHQTLRLDQAMRLRRETATQQPAPEPAPDGPPSTRRLVHDAGQEMALPGNLVRAEGDPPVGDVGADEAYDSSGAVIALFAEEFGRASFDGRGGPVLITVHYARNYDNAFWDGEQLVFGDGDGVIFERFTKPMDVMAHEFAHAVTQYTTGLRYEGQSGALNESLSDVFASLTRQRALGQTADEADWLIGVGLFRPGVRARALRSMIEPGTAYDDPQLGVDPQVGHMDAYIETTDDNGGVHLNSGIPNRAFALAATALGGHAWQRAGAVWYEAITSGDVRRSTDFAGFARATVAAAERQHPEDTSVAEQVREAWVSVGVLGAHDAEVPPITAPSPPGTGATPPADQASSPEEAPGQKVPPGEPRSAPADLPQPSPPPASPDAAPVVAVQRRGGFAGVVRRGQLDLTHDPHAEEVRALLRHIDLRAISPSRPQPDRFIYTVEYGHVRVNLTEQDLTPELSKVVQIVLGGPDGPPSLD